MSLRIGIARRLLASHWSAASAGVLIFAAHSYWLKRSEHVADVISGFGVSLAVLGLLVAAQPFIEKGVEETAREDVGIAHASKDKSELEEHIETKAVARVLKERVVGVALIAVGTLLNGYANAIARLLKLPV